MADINTPVFHAAVHDHTPIERPDRTRLREYKHQLTLIKNMPCSTHRQLQPVLVALEELNRRLSQVPDGWAVGAFRAEITEVKRQSIQRARFVIPYADLNPILLQLSTVNQSAGFFSPSNYRACQLRESHRIARAYYHHENIQLVDFLAYRRHGQDSLCMAMERKGLRKKSTSSSVFLAFKVAMNAYAPGLGDEIHRQEQARLLDEEQTTAQHNRALFYHVAASSGVGFPMACSYQSIMRANGHG